jgi:hypothetical protein
MSNKLILQKPTKTLTHYGVLGMKWGKRKKIEEPISTKNKRKNVISDSWKDDLIRKSKSQPTKTKTPFDYLADTSRRTKSETSKGFNTDDTYKYDAILTKKYGDKWTKLPEPFKKIAHLTYSKNFTEVWFGDEYLPKLNKYLKNTKHITSFKELKKYSGPNTMESQSNDVLGNDWRLRKEFIEYSKNGTTSGIKKNFDEDLDKLYMLNCTNCAATYELRRRGYDVEAMGYYQGITMNSDRNEDYQQNYKGELKWHTNFSAKELEKKILGIARGDQRGYITSPGHIFNYEVKNGKVYFIDVQFGGLNHHTTEKLFEDQGDTKCFSFARTDNLELDSSILTRVRNRDDTDSIKKRGMTR